jgi:hypothetical protein
MALRAQQLERVNQVRAGCVEHARANTVLLVAETREALGEVLFAAGGATWIRGTAAR